MKTALVVYRKGNVKQKKLKWGDFKPLYLNLSKRSMDDIQGMRFDTIITCEGVTEVDKENLNKYLLETGVIL